MTKALLTSLLLACCAVAFVVESRARACGAGICNTALPFGIVASWFNGNFWLTDADGFGIVAPPVDIALSDGSRLDVSRIEAYSWHDGVVLVRITLSSGDSRTIALEKDDRGGVRKLIAPTSAETAAMHWVSVRPDDCMNGLFGVARGLLACVAVALVFGLARSVRS